MDFVAKMRKKLAVAHQFEVALDRLSHNVMRLQLLQKKTGRLGSPHAKSPVASFGSPPLVFPGSVLDGDGKDVATPTPSLADSKRNADDLVGDESDHDVSEIVHVASNIYSDDDEADTFLDDAFVAADDFPRGEVLKGTYTEIHGIEIVLQLVQSLGSSSTQNKRIRGKQAVDRGFDIPCVQPVEDDGGVVAVSDAEGIPVPSSEGASASDEMETPPLSKTQLRNMRKRAAKAAAESSKALVGSIVDIHLEAKMAGGSKTIKNKHPTKTASSK